MKYKKGFIYGVISGLLIAIFVFISHECTDCFSCGFLGIDHCRNLGGVCTFAGGVMDIVSIVSFPFIVLGLLIMQLYSFNLDIINFFYILTPLYLLYSGFLGIIIQKLLKNYRQK